MPATPPESHVDLLERPTFAHLATVRPDGSPQSNIMWFDYADGVLRFSHTSSRQKYRNIENEKRISASIPDPENPYRFIEVRGEVTSIEPDTADAAFMKSLQRRYGQEWEVTDADERVVITVTPTGFVTK